MKPGVLFGRPQDVNLPVPFRLVNLPISQLVLEDLAEPCGFCLAGCYIYDIRAVHPIVIDLKTIAFAGDGA